MNIEIIEPRAGFKLKKGQEMALVVNVKDGVKPYRLKVIVKNQGDGSTRDLHEEENLDLIKFSFPVDCAPGKYDILCIVTDAGNETAQKLVHNLSVTE